MSCNGNCLLADLNSDGICDEEGLAYAEGPIVSELDTAFSDILGIEWLSQLHHVYYAADESTDVLSSVFSGHGILSRIEGNENPCSMRCWNPVSNSARLWMRQTAVFFGPSLT